METVDGVITMKIPAGTQSGTDFKLSGHGVPRTCIANLVVRILWVLLLMRRPN